MASEAVNRILNAEAEADKKIADARRRAEEIIEQAHQQGAVTIQKRIADARAETEKIRKSNNENLSKYWKNADRECEKSLELLRNQVNNNTEKAVSAITDRFF
ncbi:MAG: hypothetical protein K2I00_07690 [Ruminococcus sp.]|nr:hypothetical protein [Ruminococcus sp.]